MSFFLFLFVVLREERELADVMAVCMTRSGGRFGRGRVVFGLDGWLGWVEAFNWSDPVMAWLDTLEIDTTARCRGDFWQLELRRDRIMALECVSKEEPRWG